MLIFLRNRFRFIINFFIFRGYGWYGGMYHHTILQCQIYEEFSACVLLQKSLLHNIV